jgi:hypothetical protein
MGKIRSVYVLFGISPRIWNGLRTYTEVPLYLMRFTYKQLQIFLFLTELRELMAKQLGKYPVQISARVWAILSWMLRGFFR